MTAASAYSPDATEGRPSEPSMEDILASIRRIIADDQSQGSKPSSGNGARRMAEEAPEGDRSVARARTPYDDVLDLARLVPSTDPDADLPSGGAMQLATTHADVAAPVDDGRGEEGDLRHELETATASGLRARLPEPGGRAATQDEDQHRLDHPVPAVTEEEEEDSDLLSAPLGASVMSAFETLAATVVLQNTPMLERVMRDLLRPMLKTWLDDNLPAVVERLVRTEIERVARGSRG